MATLQAGLGPGDRLPREPDPATRQAGFGPCLDNCVAFWTKIEIQVPDWVRKVAWEAGLQTTRGVSMFGMKPA